MNPKSPKRAELKSLAEENHFTLTGEELDIFPEAAVNIISSFRRLDELSSLFGHKEIKRSGHLPTRKENPLGAWAWKCSIKTSAEGKLAGKKIAIKDNVLVLGVPLRDGSPLFAGYVPDVNATIVSRILSEGGEIVGKSTCENLCFSGGSHTSYPAPCETPGIQSTWQGDLRAEAPPSSPVERLRWQSGETRPVPSESRVPGAVCSD